MSTNNKTDLLDWLGLRRRPEYSKARWLGPIISGAVIVIILMLVVPTALEFFKAVTGIDQFDDDADQSAAIRNTGLVLAAVIGVPFVVWRSVVAQKQVDVAEQGHITDRINKAVEGLGATKLTKTVYETPRYQKKAGEWIRDDDGNPVPALRPDGQEIIEREVIETSEPNLEVRIGAIYALERIAQDSDRDHIQIMEILCAYIRGNAPAHLSVIVPTDWDNFVGFLRQFAEITPGAFVDLNTAVKIAINRAVTPRPDIQVAIDVIGRRTQEQIEIERNYKKEPSHIGYRLNLMDCNLQGIEMLQGNFDFALFENSHLEFCGMRCGSFESASFNGARLQGAQAQEAKFGGAFLRQSNLIAADFSKSEFSSPRTTILHLCQTNESIFSGCLVENARILFLSGNVPPLLDFAAFRNLSLSKSGVSTDMIQKSFADASVTLPNGNGPDHPDWPSHWPKFDLGFDFYSEWRKWQADPEGYVPPEPPDDPG
ncbi:pentapeptide repeat-containing protein [Roseovarius sp. CAU 1744]|uniref:pentapeptide repeat-containing protein n=1 Tax=Roseovarius sp. CAU 1744 TaxID=3140368 RepID=UPI00325B781A